jgi:putative redox protein
MSDRAAVGVKPDVVVDLAWEGDNRFRGRSGETELVMDSPPKAGPNPVQTLALALAGCMAMDVLLVIQRGRYPLEALTTRLVAERAPGDPRRVLKLDLRFTVKGDVPPDRVARAIQLSRDSYCSVWHSLREDIELTTGFEVLAGGTGGA